MLYALLEMDNGEIKIIGHTDPRVVVRQLQSSCIVKVLEVFETR